MLIEYQLIPGAVKQNPVVLPGSVRSFHKLVKSVDRVFAVFDDCKFFFVHLQHNAGCFLVECVRSTEKQQQCKNKLFHFLGLLFLCVSLLNVDTFSACSASDCNLYESPEYQGCSPTSGNNQYQCGGGTGTCSDVCGGCGWRIRTSGYQQRYQSLLDSLCWEKMNSAGLPCSRANSKCSGLRPLRTIVIGLCGVGYDTDFDVETICTCIDRSSSSSSLSSSSSAPLSSSSFRYRDCISSPASRELCYYAGPDNESCGNQQANSWSPSCRQNGFACAARGLTQSDCWLGRVHVFAATWDYYENVGCTNVGCPSSSAPSSSSVAPSSSAPSSDSGSSSDSGEGGGGGSGGGESSSDSGGGGAEGVTPCGWGDYPPCEVFQVNNAPGFCELYPELCYQIGGIDDSISRYGSAIADSLGRLIGRIDSLGSGGAGSCLDSANCDPSSWSGDSIPYVSGDSSSSGSADTSGTGWVRSILAAATIPQASRTCPKIPSADFDLLGRPYKLEYNICGEEFNIGGRHVLQLVGEILRAVCGLLAVFIVLGAISSFNAGLHRMRVLGK